MKIKQKMRLKGVVIIIQMLAICTLSCSDKNNEIIYNYSIPANTGDGWDVASLSSVGLDESPIAQFMNDLLNNLEHKIHGILIIKDGKLVLEEYFPGYRFYHGPFTDYNRETTHDLASVSKSFTATLIGLAIDKGYINNLDQKVLDFFPEYTDLIDSEKHTITLEHLLTMSSGLEWDETTYPYADERNDIYRLQHDSNPILSTLNKPLISEPGLQFYYNSGLTNVMGEIINKATGQRVDDFAAVNLFAPLGINEYNWYILPSGVIYTAGDLKLFPRAMAKLGELYLEKGKWKGQQVLSAWWVNESSKSQISIDQFWDYGYHWWLHTYEINSENIESFSARGWGGQNIIVFPSLDMVVVTTAGYHDDPELEFHIDVLLIQKVLESVL